MIGQVRTYDPKKGWGCIDGDDGEEYFLGKNEIRLPSRSISAGYTVQFIPGNGFPRKKAIDVRLL